MRRLKWGVIGAGGIADRRTIPGMMLADNARLVAVMEINRPLAEALAKKYGAAFAFDNEDELLQSPEVEAVYIASPVGAHLEQAKKAIAAGKHILLEKPLALTSGEGEALTALCAEKKLLFATGFMMRFHAYHVKARELVQGGALGQIVSMRAQLTCWYPDMPGNWRQSRALAGGGSLMDMGVHCIDLLQFISGARVRRLAALTGTKTFSYDVEDSASVIMEFENGAYGYVDANFNIPDNAAQCRLEVYGTKGSILASGTIGQVEGGRLALTLSGDSGYDAAQERNQDGSVDVKVAFGNMYTKQVESFGNSVLYGAPLAVPASDAVQVQRVIELAYQSSKTGRFEAL